MQLNCFTAVNEASSINMTEAYTCKLTFILLAIVFVTKYIKLPAYHPQISKHNALHLTLP